MLYSTLLLCLAFDVLLISAWWLRPIISVPCSSCRRTTRVPFLGDERGPRRLFYSQSDVLDVEFEPVNPKNVTSDTTVNRSAPRNALGEETAKSLLDLSIEADPDFASYRIPFLDYGAGGSSAKEGGTNYIDVQVAFMADLDGVQYGIGVPSDPVVAITLENPDGSVQYFSPDTDDNEELMQIMAAQLHEHMGTDLRLQKTPRVLTVAGPLENYTQDWREKILPEPVAAKDLMDSSDDTLDFFHKFMREELGDAEYEKTMNGQDDDDLEITDELMQLFEIPGLSDNMDPESMNEFMESILTPEKDFEEAKQSLGLNSLDEEGVALKLISYVFGDGKSYSLVKLLKPYVIVGRFVPDDNDPRFELLTTQEERVVLPKLEEACKADLQKAGLLGLSN